MDPLVRRKLGRTNVEITQLGLGGAGLRDLFDVVEDADANATLLAAWDAGILEVPTHLVAGTAVLPGHATDRRQDRRRQRRSVRLPPRTARFRADSGAPDRHQPQDPLAAR
ncbi:MAG: D-threo-aldose 1-dehydrogenase [Acetobacteraceae bacterium]|nr:D-threo-aldose 1-dehydrogenase [Acetobacteraceae bacterium]